MSHSKNLAVEAKQLRDRIDSAQIEAARISAELPALEAEAEGYAAMCLSGEVALPARADEVTARRGWITSRLLALESERLDDEQRLRTITIRLEAGPRAEQARVNVRKAQEWIPAAQRRRDAHAAAVDRLHAMQQAHDAQAADSAHRSTAAILASVGLEGDTPAGDVITAAESAAHAQQGLALDAAVREAQATLEKLDADCDAAREALRTAREELAVQLSAVAEMRHAEALGDYLQKLAAFQAAHDVAHKWLPRAPDVGALVSSAIEAAKAAFRESLDEPPAGPVAKVAKAARGLFA